MKKVKIRHNLSSGWTKVLEANTSFRGVFLITLSGSIGGARSVASYIMVVNIVTGKTSSVYVTPVANGNTHPEIGVKWLAVTSTRINVWILGSGVKSIIPLGSSKPIEILDILETPPEEANTAL